MNDVKSKIENFNRLFQTNEAPDLEFDAKNNKRYSGSLNRGPGASPGGRPPLPNQHHRMNGLTAGVYPDVATKLRSASFVWSDDVTHADISLKTEGYQHTQDRPIQQKLVAPNHKNAMTSNEYEEFDDTETFVQRQFDRIDRNHDGFLTVDEAAATIRNLGFNETEAVDFIRTFDRNSDGRVTLVEFRESLSSYSMEDYENMKFHYFFKKLDTDGNGTLSIRELRDFLALIGYNAEIPVIKDFIKSLTRDSKETIDEETFVKFLKQEIRGL